MQFLWVVTQFFWGGYTVFWGWLCNFCCGTTFTLEIIVLSTMQPCLPCMLMREGPTLSMCRHSNEGNALTKLVQSLYWACADILMREIH